MGNMVRGWALARESLRVAFADGSLAVLVVLGTVTSVAVAAAVFVPAAIGWSTNHWLAGFLIVAGTYLTTATGVFFAVALAAAAANVLDGGSATVGRSLRVAASRLEPILGWALFLTTVNLVLQALRNRGGVLGNIVGAIGGVTWNLVTFLVVPILALEGLSASDALARSGQIFRERWGDQVVGRVSISGIFLVFGALPALALGALGIASGSRGIMVMLLAVAIALMIAAGVMAAAARAVFAVALYRFAVGKGAIAPFSEGDLGQAVAPRSTLL